MKLFENRQEIMEVMKRIRSNGKTIGFVPTMGFLHEGHLSLIRQAKAENDIVVVSIFVNPKQFGPQEDFSKYPRNFEKDKALVEPLVDYLFYPAVSEMYGEDEEITLNIGSIAQCLCGVSRPHHFSGVAMVLSKFFHILFPHRIYLGQKDYQQTVVTRYLIHDLGFDLQLIVCPTIRENDGLAMSSRNVYLSADERKKAPFLYEALKLGVNLLQSGERKSEVIIQEVWKFLEKNGITQIEYIDLRDSENLEKVDFVSQRKVVLALAVFIGKTRLIDNTLFSP